MADMAVNTDSTICEISELLCYIFHYYKSASVQDIQKVIMHYFIPDEIRNAKELLKKCYSKVLEDKPVRRASSTRNAHEADFYDIMEYVHTLDQSVHTPRITFVAFNLDKIPNISPNECDVFDMAIRLNKLESQFGLLKSKEDEKGMLTVDDPQAQNPTSYLEAAKAGTDDVSTSNTPDEFRLPKEQVRNIKKAARRKKRVIFGNSSESSDLKGGDFSKSLFIFHITKETSTDSVRNFVEKKVKVKELTLLSHEASKFKSFKVTVAKSDVEIMMNENFWPEGVGCKYFWKRNVKDFDSPAKQTPAWNIKE